MAEHMNRAPIETGWNSEDVFDYLKKKLDSIQMKGYLGFQATGCMGVKIHVSAAAMTYRKRLVSFTPR